MSKQNPVTGRFFYDKNIWNSLPQKHQIYWTDKWSTHLKTGPLGWVLAFDCRNLIWKNCYSCNSSVCITYVINCNFFFFILPQYIPNNIVFSRCIYWPRTSPYPWTRKDITYLRIKCWELCMQCMVLECLHLSSIQLEGQYTFLIMQNTNTTQYLYYQRWKRNYVSNSRSYLKQKSWWFDAHLE